jgi:hypothetical protein
MRQKFKEYHTSLAIDEADLVIWLLMMIQLIIWLLIWLLMVLMLLFMLLGFIILLLSKRHLRYRT